MPNWHQRQSNGPDHNLLAIKMNCNQVLSAASYSASRISLLHERFESEVSH